MINLISFTGVFYLKFKYLPPRFLTISDFNKLYYKHMSVRHHVDVNLEIRPAKKITDLVAIGEKLTEEVLRARTSDVLTHNGFDDKDLIIEDMNATGQSKEFRIRLNKSEGIFGGLFSSDFSYSHMLIQLVSKNIWSWCV